MRLSALAAALLSAAWPLAANPTGGAVAAGSASIASAGTTETITQSTQQAIINWQQFSIASNEATKFFVPNASSATLNRVLGGNPSAIYGSLSSNGQLIVVNPNGIVVGPTGRIDTASFIGSTLAISDNDFLSGGNLHFSGDGSTGTVDNEGTIHAETGDVYLIGSQVTNGGRISAPQGTAGLAAGSDILFEQAGDQHLYVQATPLDATRAVGVTNSGTIHAAAAVLKAAGGNAYALAINNTGQIVATGFKKVHGQVLLTADGGNIDNSGIIVAHEANGNGGRIVLNGYGKTAKGNVLNSGELIATGRKSGTKGGTVEVLGNQVGITGFGLVDVSGDAGGGTALIGGDEHGANAAIPDADQTYLGPDAKIEADAFTLGDGGKVILWSNETTKAYGAISARGGAQGGNGGFVETSGQTLTTQLAPDLAAPKGQGGNWLLDPADITIGDQPGDTDSQDNLQTALDMGATITLDASTRSGTSTNGGTITWTGDPSDPFTLSLMNGPATLVLNGPGGVFINNVTMSAKGDAFNLVLNASIAGAGPIQVNDSSITTDGGNFTANGNGYASSTDANGNPNGIDIAGTTINSQGGSITLTGAGGYVYDGVENVAGNGVYLHADEIGPTILEATGNGNVTIHATTGGSLAAEQGLYAFFDYGTGNQISVANGTVSVTGTVTGLADGTAEDGASLIGVEVGDSAMIEATGTGSVTLTGDISGASSTVTGSNFSFADGIEIGSDASVSVQGGTLTLMGTGTSIDASGYDGIDHVFGSGVQLDNDSAVSAGTNGTISITGTINSGAVGQSADLIGTLMTLGSTVNGGDGAQITLTGTTTGSNVISAADGSTNVGLEIDGNIPETPVETDAVVEDSETTSATAVSVGANGSLTFTGTSGSIDGSLNSNQGNQAGAAGIDLDSGVQITAGVGTSVTMTGTGGAATVVTHPTSGFTAVTGGVVISDSNLDFQGNNTVLITGHGGTADNGDNMASNTSNPAESIGVDFEYGPDSLVSLASGGSLTVYGYGGAVSTVNASASTIGDTFAQSLGVGIESNVEALGNSTIALHGTGGDITSGALVDGASFGIDIGSDDNAVVLSTETGALVIDGTAGTAPNLGVGVVLHGFNGNLASVSTLGGDITITGTGGPGNSGPGTGSDMFTGFFEPNYGVAAVEDVKISTTNAGTISITGTDGAGDVNGGGVAFTTTGDPNVNSEVDQPDIDAAGAVTINALSGGGIVLATTTVEAPSVQIGSTSVNEGVTTVTSGPVRLFDVDFTLTGPLTVYGAGGGTLDDAIAIDSSTLDAGTGDISILASGGTANTTGLDVDGSTIETSGEGTINLTGDVSGSRNGLDVVGTYLFDSQLSTATGAISVTGRAATGVSSGKTLGLEITSGSIQVTSDGGSVTLLGNTTGSTAVDASNIGLMLDGDVSTLDGAGISATGTSGGAAFDSDFTAAAANTDGAIVSANLSTTGAAPITITGTGGMIVDKTGKASALKSIGAAFSNESGTAETISTDRGTITITGTGGKSDNSGFGVGMFASADSPFNIQSTTGEIVVNGTAGATTSSETSGSSPTYEPNIGVAMGDAINLSTGGSISITGKGAALASDDNSAGSGIAVKIDSFDGYQDGAGNSDSAPTTPTLSAEGTISLTSLAGTVEVDEEEGAIPGHEISGNFIVTTPLQPDLSLLDNLTGTITLGGGGYYLSTDAALTVQTGTGVAGYIQIDDTAGIQLGAITTGFLGLDAFTGSITQSGAITASELEVNEASMVTLPNLDNNISILDAISSTGAISIYTDPGLLLTGSVTGAGPVLLESFGGGLTLGAGASVTDTGSGNVTLVTDQAFVNDSTAGAGALVASNGYYHIYAGDSTDTYLGGLPLNSPQYNTSYSVGSTQTRNEIFYADDGGGTQSGGTQGGGNGNTPPTTTGGGTLLPPVVAAPPLPPAVFNSPYNGGTPPPSFFFSGTGDVSQIGSQSGGLAFSSGNGGQVGAGDAAQLNNGQMNNVSNPQASGALDTALSGAVHETLVDALMSVGAFADSETYGDTSDDDQKKKGDKEQVISDGGVVEIGGGTVTQIPLSSAPKPLQDALNSGVMHGLQPAGH